MKSISKKSFRKYRVSSFLGNEEVAELLIKNGADLVGQDGNTVCVLAASHGKKNIVKTFIHS